jgi:hypothetical protein
MQEKETNANASGHEALSTDASYSSSRIELARRPKTGVSYRSKVSASEMLVREYKGKGGDIPSR